MYYLYFLLYNYNKSSLSQIVTLIIMKILAQTTLIILRIKLKKYYILPYIIKAKQKLVVLKTACSNTRYVNLYDL